MKASHARRGRTPEHGSAAAAIRGQKTPSRPAAVRRARPAKAGVPGGSGLLQEARFAAIVDHTARLIGTAPRDPLLFVQAFVHRSYVHEDPDFPLGSNERLEFLGDSVLGYLATDLLFHAYPQLDEGELTLLRDALVRSTTLARWALSLELGERAVLGRGEASSGGRTRPTILANLFEAFVGAVALDQGLSAARALVLGFLEPEAERALRERATKDYKSQLQEATQTAFQITPVYRIVGRAPDPASPGGRAGRGGEHERLFRVEVSLNGHVLA